MRAAFEISTYKEFSIQLSKSHKCVNVKSMIDLYEYKATNVHYSK